MIHRVLVLIKINTVLNELASNHWNKYPTVLLKLLSRSLRLNFRYPKHLFENGSKHAEMKMLIIEILIYFRI